MRVLVSYAFGLGRMARDLSKAWSKYRAWETGFLILVTFGFYGRIIRERKPSYEQIFTSILCSVGRD